VTRKIALIKTTVNSEEEAKEIIDALMKSELAASIQYFPISSVYRWKGQIEKSEEFVLFIKSTHSKFKAIEQKIKEIHVYEVPEIVMIPIEKASEEYHKWIVDQVK